MITYTTILHKAREKLGLSLNEYALVDIIYQLQNNPASKHKGWCYSSKNYLGKCIGVSEQAVHGMLNRLYDKGLLEKQEETKHIKATKRWYDLVVVMRKSMNTKESLASLKKVESDTKETLVDDTKESLVNNNIRDKDIDIDNKDYVLIGEKLERIVEKYNALFDKSCRTTAGRKSKLKTRLETYSLDEILKAVKNASKNKFYSGRNDRKWVMGLDYLLRNDENIDRLLNLEIQSSSPKKILT